MIMESEIPGPSSASKIASTSSVSSPITSELHQKPATAGPSHSSTSASPESSNKKKEDSSDDDRENEKAFECNICLDVAKDAVVSYCGHLFCWPCLHQWLETRPTRQSCPVCKAAISRDKVIPLYGRGGPSVDPRSKIPPRPTPTRTEQPDSNRFTWGGGNAADGAQGGFHMSFGIGAFPFGFFASAFNWGQNGVPVAGQNFVNPDQVEEQEFLSKVFLWIAIIFMVWLLLA